MKEIISTIGAPAAIGPYSQGVRAGGFLFISGQLPIDPTSGEIACEDTGGQTRLVLENIKSILGAAGLGLKHVVKTSVFLNDINDFSEMNDVYAFFFTSEFPVRVTFEVARLPKNAKVEIEAIAICS